MCLPDECFLSFFLSFSLSFEEEGGGEVVLRCHQEKMNLKESGRRGLTPRVGGVPVVPARTQRRARVGQASVERRRSLGDELTALCLFRDFGHAIAFSLKKERKIDRKEKKRRVAGTVRERRSEEEALLITTSYNPVPASWSCAGRKKMLANRQRSKQRSKLLRAERGLPRNAPRAFFTSR